MFGKLNTKGSMSISNSVSQELNIEIADSTCLIAEQVYKANPKKPANSRVNTMSRIAVSVYLTELNNNIHDIAKYLGKHRTSVMHYLKTHPDRLKYDSEYRNLHVLFLQRIESNEYSKQMDRFL